MRAYISTLLQIRGLLGLQTPPSRFAMAVGTVTGNPDQFGAAAGLLSVNGAAAGTGHATKDKLIAGVGGALVTAAPGKILASSPLWPRRRVCGLAQGPASPPSAA